MVKQGLIPFDRLAVLYVLGRYSLTRTGLPRDLLPFLAPDMPRFASWSVCAYGRRETACVTAAALLGGHARVGFENNVSFARRGPRRLKRRSGRRRRRARSKRSGLPPQTADGLQGGDRGGDGAVNGLRHATLEDCVWCIRFHKPK